MNRLPSDIVDILVSDADENVRAHAAGIENLSPANVEKLANDPNPEVRKNLVAFCSRFPEHLESKMLNDPDPEVRERAKRSFPNRRYDNDEFYVRSNDETT